jgi:hypothetical protein
MGLSFRKIVGKTIEKGQITVPNEHYPFLDKTNYCPLGASVDIFYILSSNLKIAGRLYQSENNTTTYYQFYIIDPSDKKLFAERLKNHRLVNFDFVPTDRHLHVTPA